MKNLIPFLAAGIFGTACTQIPTANSSCPQSVAVGTVSGEESAVMGGLLSVKSWKDADTAVSAILPSEADFRYSICAVIVRPNPANIQNVTLITASHCTPFHRAEEVALELFIQGAYTRLPLSIEIIEASKKLRTLPGVDAESRKRLGSAFKKLIEVGVTGSRDAGREDEVHASFQDLDFLEARITAPIDAIVTEALLKAARTDGSATREISTGTFDTVRTWFNALARKNRASRNYQFSKEVKRINDCLTTLASDPSCGKALIIKNSIPGVVPEPMLSVFRDITAYETAKDEYDQATEALTSLWPTVASIMSANEKFTYLSTNYITEAGAPKSGFMTFSLANIFGQNLSSFVGRDGLDIVQASNALKFRLGDSGSLFSFAGNTPLLVVSTVGNDPSSGGAAMMPLPRKRTAAPPSSGGANQESPCGAVNHPPAK